ncbi:unnamed protein product [Lathyrus oleraceus]
MKNLATATSKGWIVAASVGAVEALKDQVGICRWNYAIRQAQQHLKNRVRLYSQAKSISSSSHVACKLKDEKKAKQAEESLRTVMYLSCWGPN